MLAEKRFLKLQKSLHVEGLPGFLLKKPHWAADGRVKHIHWQIVSKNEGREVELYRSIPSQMKEFYPSKVRQILSSQNYCKTCPTPIEQGVPQQAVSCKEFTSLCGLKNFYKFSCLFGRPCRVETCFGSTLTFFPLQSIARDNNPAYKHALKAKISSEGTKKAGRLERQLVKKKTATHPRTGGSFMDNQCLGFVVNKLNRRKTR